MMNDEILWKKIDDIKQQGAQPKAKPSKPEHAPAKAAQEQGTEVGSSGDAKQSTKKPSNHGTKQPSRHATMTPRYHDTVIPHMVESVRKQVRQAGKEAATHRFSVAEKQAIADIVYTYGRQGHRTTENEIARIAVNWLLLEYGEHGKDSVLHRVLEALRQ